MIVLKTEHGIISQDKNNVLRVIWSKSFKAEQAKYTDQLQIYIDNTVMRNMDRYVPFRTGILRKSVILGSKIGSGELVYVAPYAHKQYYRKDEPKSDGSGGKWFQRMWAARGDSIIREIKNYSRRINK